MLLLQFGFTGPLLPMPFHPDRTLLKALIVSLSAHAFLLVEVPLLLPVGPEARSTVITVSIPPAGSARLQSPARQFEHPPLGRPLIPEKLKPPQDHGKVLAVPDLSSKNSVNTVASPPAALSTDTDTFAESVALEPARSLTSGIAGRSPLPDARASGAGLQSSQQEGISADEVRQYRTALAISAKRFKRYPALARERGWEGSVEVVLDFRRVLPAPAVSVSSSSGRGLLDDQALEMIRQAAGVTGIPEPLRGRDFRVLIPITFTLDDER